MKNQAPFYVLLGLLAALSAWMLAPFLAPVVVAAVTGYLLTPLYNFLGRWVNSPRCALLCYCCWCCLRWLFPCFSR